MSRARSRRCSPPPSAKFVGDDLPVGIRAWDGSQAGSARARPVVRAPQPPRAAAAALAARRARPRPGVRHRRPRRRGRPRRRPPPGVGVRPRARSHARRYARPVRRDRHRGAPRRVRAAAAAAGVGGAHPRSPAQPGARPGRHRAPLRPLQRLLRARARRAHGLLVRVLRAEGHGRPVTGRGAGGEVRARVHQARAACPACACSTSAVGGDR